MGAVGKFFNLLAFQTPGKQLVRHAEGAGAELDAANSLLPDIERLGSKLPNDPIFGDRSGRNAAINNFAEMRNRFSSASSDAYAARNSIDESVAANTLTAHISATSAASGADWLASRYANVPTSVMGDVYDAARYGDDAVRQLDQALYTSSPEAKRNAAGWAENALDHGYGRMDNATDRLVDMLGAYRPHDRARNAAESSLSEAAYDGAKAANVDRTTAETARLADALGDTTNAAARTIDDLPEGAPTGAVATDVTAASSAARALETAARAEPTPPGWGRDVALAWTGTTAALGGAGYGTYALVKD